MKISAKEAIELSKVKLPELLEQRRKFQEDLLNELFKTIKSNAEKGETFCFYSCMGYLSEENTKMVTDLGYELEDTKWTTGPSNNPEIRIDKNGCIKWGHLL